MRVIDISRFLIKLFFVYILIQLVCAPPALYQTDVSPIKDNEHELSINQSQHSALIVALVDDAFSSLENSIILASTYEIAYSSNSIVQTKLIHNSNIREPISVSHDQKIFPILIKKVDSYNKQVQNIDREVGMPILGFYDGDAVIPTVLIVYDRIGTGYIYTGVIAHELLHSIGMYHSNYYGQLMYPVISAACLGSHDALQLAHMFGVSPDDMHPCKSAFDEDMVCWKDYPGNY